MRPRPRSRHRLFWGFLAVLALVAGACGDSADGSGDSAGSGTGATSAESADGAGSPETGTESVEASASPELPPETGVYLRRRLGTESVEASASPEQSGGEIVLAVEQWPECLNPLTSCANATWLLWSVLVHVQPGLMEYDVNNNIGASPLLVEAPTVDNGGAVLNDDGTLTITYRLDPEARWSDGTTITSTDVWFTWRAVIDTEGSLNTIGYDLITAVDHDDPQTAVVTFSEPYAPWRYLFGAILPAHAFDGETDISGHWNDSIPISGGPWRQKSWSQEQHILVPNQNYWEPERIPRVDRVVMVPSEANGFSGQNFTAYVSRQATDLAFAIDAEIDEAARLGLVRELGALLAEDVPWIPLYVLPNLLAWNPEVLEGPGAWVSSVYGGFYDTYDWSVVG